MPSPRALRRVAIRLAAFLGATTSACSFFAPSDRELLGGTSGRQLTNRDASATDSGSGTGGSTGSGGAPVEHGGSSPTPAGGTNGGGCADCTTGGMPDPPDATTADAGSDAGDAGRAPTPPSPAAPLDKLRLDLHCGAQDGTSDSCKMQLPSGTSCPAEGYQWSRVVVFGGSSTTNYWVKLRIRGIVEPKVYAGGVADLAASNGRFYEGGAPGGDSTFNEYGLTISAPGQSFFINNWMEGDYVIALDYTETLLVRGGAKVSLFTYSKKCAQEYDCADLSKAPNCTAKPLSGVAHLDDKGQFVQLDVVNVAVAPATAKPGLQVNAL